MMGRKGLFGRNMGFQTPGIGDGLPGMPERLPNMASVPTTAGGVFGNAMPAEASPRQVGAGWKNVLLNALGGAADGAATFFGGQPLIAQNRQFERLQAERLAAEQRQRAADLADYESKLQIKQRYEQPQMDEFDTAMARAGIAKGTPEYIQYAREYAVRKASGPDPLLQGAPLPGGGSYTGPFSDYRGIVGGQSAPKVLGQTLPQGWTIEGGTGGNVGGGFR